MVSRSERTTMSIRNMTMECCLTTLCLASATTSDGGTHCGHPQTMPAQVEAPFLPSHEPSRAANTVFFENDAAFVRQPMFANAKNVTLISTELALGQTRNLGRMLAICLPFHACNLVGTTSKYE